MLSNLFVLFTTVKIINESTDIIICVDNNSIMFSNTPNILQNGLILVCNQINITFVTIKYRLLII